jgi:phospholipase C
MRWLTPGRVAVVLALAGPFAVAVAQPGSAATTVPHYDHVALIVEENHGFADIIGNPHAPNLNRLARTYGLATQYYGTSDPSAPNYVAMLGGNDFGIADDNPFYLHRVDAPSLMDQLDAAGLTWKGYFQSMPYPGYAQYCFPVRCNGTPDSDPLYSGKHNGMAYFASIQDSPAKRARMVPGTQLDTDLAAGRLPTFAYIVPDQCTDMHGSPPWCEDSGDPGDVNDNRLVSDADAYLGRTVAAITRSAQWQQGRNAIVITFDEGDDNAGCCGVPGAGRVATVVITNHGPRGLQDPAPYSHYSLLATVEKAFGLGCLQKSCDPANGAVMAPLFGGTAASVPARPVAATAPAPRRAATATPSTAGGWKVVPGPALGSQDNSLGAVSAASPRDIWAVGNYQPDANPNVVQTLAVHYDGTQWTDVPTPNVGTGLNTLFGVKALPGGTAWAVGEHLGTDFLPRTLVEHFDGTQWTVVPSPSPSPAGRGAFFYSVTASCDRDVWAVGTTRDGSGRPHTLAEHFDGTQWTVADTPDPGTAANLLYSVATAPDGTVVAAGQRLDGHSPDRPLLERFDGHRWSVEPVPAPADASAVPFALTGTGALVGSVEPDARKADTWAAHQPTESAAGTDNFLYAAAGDWAVGTYIDPVSGNNETLVERLNGGRWSRVPSPSPGDANGGGSILGGVVTFGSHDAWAVGTFDGPDVRQVLIEHYTG